MMLLLRATALCMLALTAEASAAPLYSQTVAGSTIATLAAREALHIPHAPDQAALPVSTIADQVVPNGSLEIRCGAPAAMSATYASIPVSIYVDGALSRNLYVGYRIVSYTSGAAASHDLAQNEVLTASDIVEKRVEQNGMPAVTPQDLIGRRLNAAVVAGTPLRKDATSVNLLVHAGDPVLFIVRDGDVALTADVTARTSGGLGETVAVYDERARNSLSGTVVGPNRVELSLAEATP